MNTSTVIKKTVLMMTSPFSTFLHAAVDTLMISTAGSDFSFYWKFKQQSHGSCPASRIKSDLCH